MRIDIAGQSDIGRRKKDNEDSFGIFRDDTPGLNLFRHGAFLVVADGLGGHMGGEIASKLAVSIVKDVLKESSPPLDDGHDQAIVTLLTKHFERANMSVFQTNQDINPDSKPMGTTMVTAAITPRKVHIANVGDSRVYHFRDNEIIGRTEDHSWVDEQVKLGLMSKSEAEIDVRKNVVTRSIGTRQEVITDTYVWHVVPGDWIMLCSDGLVNMVKDVDICEEFRAGGGAAEITTRLVNLANENGGKDNITVVMANISPSLARLLYFKLRTFKRKHGFLLLWFLVSALCLLGGFMGGYIFRDTGNLLPIF